MAQCRVQFGNDFVGDFVCKYCLLCAPLAIANPPLPHQNPESGVGGALRLKRPAE